MLLSIISFTSDGYVSCNISNCVLLGPRLVSSQPLHVEFLFSSPVYSFITHPSTDNTYTQCSSSRPRCLCLFCMYPRSSRTFPRTYPDQLQALPFPNPVNVFFLIRKFRLSNSDKTRAPLNSHKELKSCTRHTDLDQEHYVHV